MPTTENEDAALTTRSALRTTLQPAQLTAAKQRWLVWWHGLPPNFRGGLWILASALLFSIMTSLAKFLGGRLDAFQVAFFRALFGFMFVIPFAVRGGLQGLATKRPLLHLVRGLLGGSAMMCGFYSMIHLPLADATALSFARALFLVVLAAIFLGEQVGMRRTIATLVGFGGVIIMTRPGGEIEFATFVALGGAVLVAFVVVIVKILSRTDNPTTLIFYSSAIAAMMAAVPALLFWRQPTLTELGLLMAMGLVGVSAQTCFIRGYSTGEATALAPLDYTRLIFAALAGYLFFQDVPDIWTISGAVVIVSSTLYITQREARLSAQKRQQEAAAAQIPDKDTPGMPPQSAPSDQDATR